MVRDSFGDLELRVPGGESAREVLDRGWAAITELLDGGHQFPIVVTHGNLLSLILNSLDPNFGYDEWESLSNPDVFASKKPTVGDWYSRDSGLNSPEEPFIFFLWIPKGVLI